jgi:hypothetical protein
VFAQPDRNAIEVYVPKVNFARTSQTCSRPVFSDGVGKSSGPAVHEEGICSCCFVGGPARRLADRQRLRTMYALSQTCISKGYACFAIAR